MTPSDTAHPEGERAEALNALEHLVVLVARDDAQLATDLERKIKPFLSVVRPQGEEGLCEVLIHAEAAAEAIRRILVKHLSEPERSAFWKAVECRDEIRAALSNQGKPSS